MSLRLARKSSVDGPQKKFCSRNQTQRTGQLRRPAILLNFLESMAVMEVLGNPNAEGFYEKLGFVRTGTVKLPFGIASKMRRALDQI